MNHLLEGLSIPEGCNFALIEEKDEIVFLNEELENQLIIKNISINEMKLEMAALKEKIIFLESPKPQPHSVGQTVAKKSVPTSQKSIEDKQRIQKKLPEKVNNLRKQQ